MNSDQKALAEKWFRGIYGGDHSVVDELAAADVVVSYPIFEKLYNTPAIRGRKAVDEFARRFASRWIDAKFEFHEILEDGNCIVMMWSFQARFVESVDADEPPEKQVHNWGGITIIRFDKQGKIIEEIGEESEPGPYARLA